MASNLTRDEARDRARLLTVQSYQVELDLTGGRGDLPLGDHGAVQLRRAGRGHLHRPDRAGGHARSR